MLGLHNFKRILTLVRAGVTDVTLGGRFHDVLHLETADGLVLGGAATTSGATNCLGVTTVVLGTALITTLERHLKTK